MTQMLKTKMWKSQLRNRQEEVISSRTGFEPNCLQHFVIELSPRSSSHHSWESRSIFKDSDCESCIFGQMTNESDHHCLPEHDDKLLRNWDFCGQVGQHERQTRGNLRLGKIMRSIEHSHFRANLWMPEESGSTCNNPEGMLTATVCNSGQTLHRRHYSQR